MARRLIAVLFVLFAVGMVAIPVGFVVDIATGEAAYGIAAIAAITALLWAAVFGLTIAMAIDYWRR